GFLESCAERLAATAAAGHFDEKFRGIASRNSSPFFEEIDFITATASRKTFPLENAAAVFVNGKRITIIVMEWTLRAFLRMIAETFAMQQRRQRKDLFGFVNRHVHRLISSARRHRRCSINQNMKPNGACRRLKRRYAPSNRSFRS